MQGGEQEDTEVYGVWPAITGLLLAVGIFVVMFTLATGFS